MINNKLGFVVSKVSITEPTKGILRYASIILNSEKSLKQLI